MSALVPLNGVPELPTSVRLTAATRTDIYTNGNPSGSNKLSAINSIAIANETATATIIALEWTNDGVTFFLLWRGTIGVDASLAADIPGLPLFLKAGAKLTATAAAGNRLTVTTSSYMLG